MATKPRQTTWGKKPTNEKFCKEGSAIQTAQIFPQEIFPLSIVNWIRLKFLTK